MIPIPYKPTSCDPTKTISCDRRQAIPPAYSNGFEISDSLRNLLIASVACGDLPLEAMIRENFDTIACIVGVEACTKPNVALVRLQVGLTDYALDAARNLVDKFISRGEGSGEAHFRGSSYRDAEAKKQSQGTSKFKSRGNSYNNFQRTSESHESSFSTSRSQADGNFRNDGTDNSYRQQNSTVVSFDDADVKGTGTGDGHSSYVSTRLSSASSGTAPNPPLPTLTASPQPRFVFNLAGLPAGIQYVPTPVVIPLPPVCSPTQVTADSEPGNCANLAPSNGAGVKTRWVAHSNATLSVGGFVAGTGTNINIKFEFSQEESESAHYRRQMVCSKGRSTVAATSASDIAYQQQDDMVSNGQTHLSASGLDRHDIQRAGTSLRTSTSLLHAESTGRMDSCGESHSFATRQAHGEAQNTGQSTSRSEGHSESENKFINRSKTVATARYFNQVFKQLRQLRDLLWKQLLNEEAITRTRKGPIASCAPRRGLSFKPLFWYANSMVCSGCFQRNCHCSTVANGAPVSEFAFSGVCK